MLLAAEGLAQGSPDAAATAETPGWIGVERGVITEVGVGRPPRAAEMLHGALLAPGFIDLQINGIDEFDFGRADAMTAAAALERITDSGCTSCLPTIVTARDADYPAMLDAIAGTRHVERARTRAAAFGVHLEGPFLGGAPGAHPRDLIRPADATTMRAWCDRHRDLVRMVTIAPEADPNFTVTRELVGRGVVVSIGHTSASLEMTQGAFAAGASMATHLFNGMSAFHHRQPGPVGAALAAESVTASIIADGIHVDPLVALITARAKSRLALITDAVGVEARSAGVVELRRRAGGAAELVDGTLAGSTLTMDAAVRNVVDWGIGLDRAITMATAIPAAAAGLSDRGRLALGQRADVVALDRSTLEVRGVWIAGVRVR